MNSKPDWNHKLAQNKKRYGGYTVFNLLFNDVPIDFMTLKDTQILEAQAEKRGREEVIEEINLYLKDFSKSSDNWRKTYTWRGIIKIVQHKLSQLTNKGNLKIIGANGIEKAFSGEFNSSKLNKDK